MGSTQERIRCFARYGMCRNGYKWVELISPISDHALTIYIRRSELCGTTFNKAEYDLFKKMMQGEIRRRHEIELTLEEVLLFRQAFDWSKIKSSLPIDLRDFFAC